MENEEERAGYSNPELQLACTCVLVYWNDFKGSTGLIYGLDTQHPETFCVILSLQLHHHTVLLLLFLFIYVF